MSTWDSGTFDNDYAMDWVQDLLDTKSLELVETTLDNVIDNGGGELEAPFAAEALAAIEVLARLQGSPGVAGDNDDVDAWVACCKRKVNGLQAEKAHRAIDLILSGQSELAQLWHASDDNDTWRAGVTALKARIRLS